MAIGSQRGSTVGSDRNFTFSITKPSFWENDERGAGVSEARRNQNSQNKQKSQETKNSDVQKLKLVGPCKLKPLKPKVGIKMAPK